MIAEFFVTACALAVSVAAGAQVPLVTPHPGLVIHESCRLRPGVYRIPNGSEKGAGAAIVILGNGIQVDCRDALIEGSDQAVDPDQRKGTAFLVKGNDVAIIGAKARGYKLGIVAMECQRLRLDGCSMCYLWKPRLGSTLEHEDENDWLSYHHNEADEWFQYGGGFYLKGCDYFDVRNCVGTGQQDGLKLVASNNGVVQDCYFSFLSGVGVALYRSSGNTIQNNQIDWCIRGYSHGVYNRGQDSAGILVYEQSNSNTFAGNSVTHGGDGFFLWAGQSTMDTGQGGCNDNVVLGNDFSYAATNGIEATFSRNVFRDNRMVECWHGVWGGYSHESRWEGNLLKNCEVGMAIEHGSHNAITGNLFVGDQVGVDLWKNASQDPSWGYPKHADTDSHDYLISRNEFDECQTGVRLRATGDVQLSADVFTKCAEKLVRGADAKGVTEDASGVKPIDRDRAAFGSFPWLKDASDFRSVYAGRKYIMVNEWGPVDFRSPVVWPRGEVKGVQASAAPKTRTASGKALEFEVVGPPGKWALTEIRGALAVSTKSGSVPGTFVVVLPRGKATDLRMSFAYKGSETFDVKGRETPEGENVPFEYRHFYAPIAWTAKWFVWGPDSDPRTHYQTFLQLAASPKVWEKRDSIDLQGSHMVRSLGLPDDHYGLVAEGDVELPEGLYSLEATTDDGIRVWVDGSVAIDSWKYQGPTTYTAKLRLSGKHHLRVEYFQIDGYAALQVALHKLS